MLDVVNSDPNPGARVQMCQDTGSGGQKWMITSENGYFKSGLRTSDGQDLVLEIVNNGGSGATLQLNKKNGSAAQLWTLNANGLTSSLNGLVLDVVNANLSPGAAVQMWPRNGTGAQAWNFRGCGNPNPPPVGKF